MGILWALYNPPRTRGKPEREHLWNIPNTVLLYQVIRIQLAAIFKVMSRLGLREIHLQRTNPGGRHSAGVPRCQEQGCHLFEDHDIHQKTQDHTMLSTLSPIVLAVAALAAPAVDPSSSGPATTSSIIGCTLFPLAPLWGQCGGKSSYSNYLKGGRLIDIRHKRIGVHWSDNLRCLSMHI